jgi:dUTPase
MGIHNWYERSAGDWEKKCYIRGVVAHVKYSDMESQMVNRPAEKVDEPRVTKLIFVDGALHSSKSEKLMKLRKDLSKGRNNVYEFTRCTPKVFEKELHNRLVPLDNIMQHYVGCRNEWEDFFHMLREAIKYEFECCQSEFEFMTEQCKSIEVDRCHAKNVSCYESCPSQLDFFGLFNIRKPVIILMDEGIFHSCSLMLGLCELYPIKSSMSPDHEAMWKDTMETARKYAVQLLEAMFTALRLCTDELEVCGAMFGLFGGMKTLDDYILNITKTITDGGLGGDPYATLYECLFNIVRAYYVTWWTGARALFGNYLPYSDGEIIRGRRRIGRGVSGEGVLWNDILMKQQELGMNVKTWLKWYFWNTDAVHSLLSSHGNTTNDNDRGDKTTYLHLSVGAARAGLCLKDLAQVATVDSAGIDVRAIGVKQITGSKDGHEGVFVDARDPLFFDTVLLRRGAEYHVYTGLVPDINKGWFVNIKGKSGVTDWKVEEGIVDSDYEGEIRIRVVPNHDVWLKKLDGWIAQLVTVYSGATTNIVPCNRKRGDDGFGAANLPITNQTKKAPNL